MAGIDQPRSTARFISADGIEGAFWVGQSSIAVVLRDLSVNGAQIEHVSPLRPSVEGRLVVTKLNAPAVVIWTRMSVPGLYRTGLRLEEKLEVVASEIRELLAEGSVRKGENTIRQREQARVERELTRARLVSGVSGGAIPIGLPRDAMLAIRNARQWMLSHPQDAVKWYQRAKAMATEDMLRIAGSGRLNRDDILAVWEYLERRYDLRDVVRALD